MQNQVGQPLLYRIIAVQCEHCGLVVGPHGCVSLSNMLSQIGQKLGVKF